MRKILYSNFLKIIMRFCFGLIYDKKYLKGTYFDSKRLGWYWAFKGISSKLFGDNRRIPWPVNPRTLVSNPNNIIFHIDDIHIFQTPGCYWQNHDAIITIGRNCQVAPNVGIITTNHNVFNIKEHVPGKDIIIGNYCWIGMNAVVLPGVSLGDHTIVAAGAVVTKSFPKGNCIIAGIPAKVIRLLENQSNI